MEENNNQDMLTFGGHLEVLRRMLYCHFKYYCHCGILSQGYHMEDASCSERAHIHYIQVDRKCCLSIWI